MTSAAVDSGDILPTIQSRAVTSSLLFVAIALNSVVIGSYNNRYRSRYTSAPYLSSSSSSSYYHDTGSEDAIDDDEDNYNDDEQEGEIRPNLLPTPSNISVGLGEKAILRCRVEYLGTKTVTWRRHGDIHPMTIGLFTFVSDSRVSSEHDRRTDDWSLVIDDVRPSDEGTYQCQINSKDDQTNFYNVHLFVQRRQIGSFVSAGPVRVTGTVVVERGGPIQLVCNTTSSAARSGSRHAQWVEWIKDDRRLSSDPDQGLIVTQKTERGGRGVVSVLAIRRSKSADAGEYQCRSSDHDVSTIRVSVLNASLEKRGTSAEKVVGEASSANAVVLYCSTSSNCCNFIRIASLLSSLAFARWR